MRRWIREPLLQFLLIGGLLFAAYAILHPRSPASRTDRRIEILPGEIDQLAESFQRQWRRPPTTAELRGLIDDRVHEEVLYREALAMGLDRDDPAIRRRLTQKFRFLTEDVAALRPPDDTELARWLAQHRDRYVAPARFTLTQIWFDPGRRGARAASDAARVAALLAAGHEPPPALRGDAFLVQPELADMTLEQIGRTLGAEFAAAVPALRAGVWTGPLHSSYGWHVVRLERRSDPPPPTLAAVRDQAERDWTEEHRRALNDALYRQLLARYQVVIDPRPAGEANAGPLDPQAGPR